MISNFFPTKLCRLLVNVEKCCRARQETDHSTTRRVRFPCWITEGYKNRMRNTYCFSTATMVTWTHLIVTLHVYCLS